MAVLPIGIGSAAGGGGGSGSIERSLRFNSADTAYLSRTPASTGSQTAWTWSGWVKRSTIATSREFIYAINNSNRISWSNSDSSQQLVFEVYNGAGADYFIQTTPVYRDPSAWYHIVAVWDSNNATAADRQRIYVNGVRITAFAASGNSIPSGATSNNWNTTSANNIGRSPIAGEYFSGYLTELYFIDGQALTPSSFGQNNTNTGVWEPKAYSGTYGTNGFYLKFADNSGTTSTTLGKDSSGNGNNWTPNNFSVTAGAGNDSLVDTPTPYGTDTGAGGEVRGNYATLNPLTNTWSAVLTNGNLNYSFTGSSTSKSVAATIAIPTTGSWYWEATLTADENENLGIGLIKTSFAPYSYSCVGTTSNAGTGNSYGRSRSFTWNGTTNTAASAWNNTSDVIQFAYDATNGKLWFGKNNTWQSGDPAAGTSPSYSSISGEFYPVVSHDSGASRSTGCIFNFGQRAFAYTAPSGFKALCTQNLPTPTIGATSTTQADNYFDVLTRSGTGATANITSYGFNPDFVWIKNRGSAISHCLFDRNRGALNRLLSNATSAEDAPAGTLTAFATNGYTLGSDTGIPNGVNGSGNTYVDWAWRAGGTGVTNTAGTRTSTVSANTTSGFSIVKWNNPSGDNYTVGHGLGVAPKMIVFKRLGSTSDWFVGHSGLTSWSYYIYLNTTAGQVNTLDTWQGTAPTSTVFYIGNSTGADNYIAYCFAPVAGYSAFGSFTGNGSADGPFVFLGFRPAFVMAKLSSATGDWNMVDDMRQTYNDASGNPVLRANLSSAEEDVDTMQGQMDLLSNGFKLRSNNSSLNANGGTIIYAAFAENPFKYSLAR